MKLTGQNQVGGLSAQRMLTRRYFMLATAASALANPGAAHAATIDTPFGSVALPASPTRIVTLDSAGAIALNHGLVPVGTTALSDISMSPAARELAKNIPLVGQTTYDGQIRYEKILALRPDLIVGMIRSGSDYSAMYRKLSTIAPTILLRAEGAGKLLDVSFQLAVAMGLEPQITEAKNGYEKRCRAMRDRWSPVLNRKIFAVVSGRDRQIVVYAPNSWSGRVLSDIGARLPAFTHNAERNGVTLSYEEIGALADVGGILYPALDGEPAPEIADFWNFTGFRDLPAAKAENMLGLKNLWPETYPDALVFLDAMEGLLQHMEDQS